MPPTDLPPTDLPSAAASTAPVQQAGLLRRNRGKLIVLALLVAVLGVGAAWTAATLAFSYSTGERIGFVQKLSKKGWFCRTWEGELAMNPVPGSVPQMFPFSVPDEAVAKKIGQFEGKKVSLHYEEKKGVPSTCFGETSHFVTDVRAVGN